MEHGDFQVRTVFTLVGGREWFGIFQRPVERIPGELATFFFFYFI